jgi:hypothetical protein
VSTLREFAAAGLNLLELRRVLTSTLNADPPQTSDENLPEQQAWFLWVAVLLKRVRPQLTSEQRQLVLDSLYPVVDLAAGKVFLAFMDGRYFTHTGMTGFVQLESGEKITAVSSEFVMSVTYNLSEFVRQQFAGIDDENSADS